MNGCNKCLKICGVLMLIVGVLFLLRDLQIWHFWNIQWWTTAFILLGIGKIGMSSCKDCSSCCEMPKKR